MPTITDWLMVGITAVYVVATIMICWANINSAKATREQIAESKKQFEETKRISVLPELWIEAEQENDTMLIPDITLMLCNPPKVNDYTYYTMFALELNNIGSGSAKEIAYSWKHDEEVYGKGSFPRPIVFPKESCTIVAEVCIAPEDIGDEDSVQSRTLSLTYKDLLNNTYEQEVELSFYVYGEKTYSEGNALRIAKCVTYPAELKTNIKETINV
ncbi:MAG: hypothetical protein J5449_03150 [Oscillospiraceae bacterium]|nr:hypothetical protein [Oscillospiraceae bacterium]